jgi:hypothetical protein
MLQAAADGANPLDIVRYTILLKQNVTQARKGVWVEKVVLTKKNGELKVEIG